MSIQVTTPKADFLDLNEIKKIQRKHWQQQADYVNCRSLFYQNLFDKKELTGDLDEITELPFTDKEMLRNDQHQFIIG